MFLSEKTHEAILARGGINHLPIPDGWDTLFPNTTVSSLSSDGIDSDNSSSDSYTEQQQFMRFPHLTLFITRFLRVPTPFDPLNRASHSPALVHPEALHFSETCSLDNQIKQLI